MRKRDDFETQEQFESYVEYMMGNPADDWENALVKVYWCFKAEGHWDVEGTCYRHRTGEYVWWPEDSLDTIPEGKAQGLYASGEYRLSKWVES